MSEVRFADLRMILEKHGRTLERISGSHHIIKKEGEPRHISVPVHRGKVGVKYIRRIEKDSGIQIIE